MDGSAFPGAQRFASAQATCLCPFGAVNESCYGYRDPPAANPAPSPCPPGVCPPPVPAVAPWPRRTGGAALRGSGVAMWTFGSSGEWSTQRPRMVMHGAELAGLRRAEDDQPRPHRKRRSRQGRSLSWASAISFSSVSQSGIGMWI